MLNKTNLFFKKKIKEKPLIIQVRVGDYTLIAPNGHPIGYHLSEFKYYSRNLPRIAKYIEVKYPTYSIIDVGANIGDTIALLRTEEVHQHVYAIEGEPSFYKILLENICQFKNVESFECFLGEQTRIEKMTFEQDEGTAKLSTNTQKTIQVQKLDDFKIKHSLPDNVKLLKIDTDGFDLKILRGAFQLIKSNKPVLFFEYDSFYLEELMDNGTEIFTELRSLGYNKILYYDNYGKFLCSISTQDVSLIKQLYAYMRNKTGAFPYYDICVVHESDDDLANHIITKEQDFFN